MDTLRIGIVGAGANTRLRHIPGFQAIPGVSVGVVCNRSESSSRAVADLFGIPRIARRWEDVVADPEIDAVCIGTWPYLHAPISIAALEAGKHVLTEARMAMNAEEGEAMLAAALNRPDLVAQVVPAPFTLKWDATIAKLLSDGALGELREIFFCKAFAASANAESPLDWRMNRAFSGNNTMYLGIYYETVRRWLGSDPERVWASGAVFTKRRRNKETGALEDAFVPETIDVLAEYDGGLRLSGRMSGLQCGAGDDFFALCGSKAALRLDIAKGQLTLAPLGAPERVVEPEPEDIGGWRVEADFVESIREGKPPRLTSFEDGLAYMRFTDAAIRSSEAGGAWETL